MTPSERVLICFGLGREIVDSKPALPSHSADKEAKAQSGYMNEPKYLASLLPLALASRPIQNQQTQALGHTD